MIVIDPDVEAVLEFMQKTIPANRLVATARRISEFAPLLWGHHEQVQVLALELSPTSVLPEKQSAATQ